MARFFAVVPFLMCMTVGNSALSGTQATKASLERFEQSIQRYQALKGRLHREVPELRVTDKSAEINNRSDALAAAIQRARGQAAQGEFFEPQIARVIKSRLVTALRGKSSESVLARINDEPALKGPPSVHLRFPTTSSLATMPAGLIDALPKLPQGLEYRLAGRTLILRDRDAALILDYLPGALPK